MQARSGAERVWQGVKVTRPGEPCHEGARARDLRPVSGVPPFRHSDPTCAQPHHYPLK